MKLPSNKRELQDALEKGHIRSNVYDLNGGHLPERLTLSQDGYKWYVYYSERGLETGKNEFDSETKACEFFFNQLMKDPSVRSSENTSTTTI